MKHDKTAMLTLPATEADADGPSSTRDVSGLQRWLAGKVIEQLNKILFNTGKTDYKAILAILLC